MSKAFTKAIASQEKEIISLKEENALLKEEVVLLKDEVVSQGKAWELKLDARPTVIDMDALLEENESLIRDALSKGKEIESLHGMVMEQVEPTPCEIHGVKECANLKCIPPEVDEE